MPEPDPLFALAGPLLGDYAAVDWAATPLGPVAGWSPALRSTVAFALDTRFAVTLLWGPEFVMVYNAAYVEMIGDKHPSALGRPAREVFPEAWDAIGPLMDQASAGRATWVTDAPITLERHGFLEETFFTFSYSPVRRADGAVEGVVDIATETTTAVHGRRRLELLVALRELLDEADRPGDVGELALPLLRAAHADLPAVEVVPAATTPADLGLTIVPADGRRVAHVPLGAGRPTLAVTLSERLAPDDGYLGFLRLIGATLSQALDRVDARTAERSLSETLQRSLLTHPAQPDGLQLAVRYQPAALQAQVGGDWHDAFVQPDGRLTIAVGDVGGHDQLAAAAMAQVRNLLRGIAFGRADPPDELLAALDETMRGLGIAAFATAVLAELSRDGERWRLKWSNAGHPPPVLLHPDGRAELLERDPDVLLGLSASERRSHETTLPPGAALVLYTDGLVERRHESLDSRFAALAGAVADGAGGDAEALADHLLERLVTAGAEDDVALLVLRVAPD